MSGFSLPLRFFRPLALIAIGGLGLGLKPADPTAAKSDLAGRVLVVTVRHDDLTDGVRLRSLRQFLGQAAAAPARAVVFDISAQSGYDPQHATLLLDDLVSYPLPMHAYVRTSALGMGALLAMACDTISLHPAAVIGGAAPTLPGKLDDPASRQTLSVLQARLRGLAALKGRSPELVGNFVGQIRGGGTPAEVGTHLEVLTLTAEEAQKQGVASAVSPTIEEALRQAGLGEDFVRIGPDRWADETAALKAAPSEVKTAEEPAKWRTDRESYTGKIIVIEVGWDDLMAKARFQFMERVLDKARREKPVALIVEMDTPGGFALETSKILRPFQDLSFPTYTFVNTHAESAGSLVALATDHIYMYPSSTIGSALPVTGMGEDLPGNLSKKIESMTRAEVRNIALAKGHNPDVAEAFVTTDTELIIDGVVISRKGDVLNLNAVEATRVFHGKPLLAKGMARSIEEIVEREGLSGEILRVDPSPLEAFAQWVQLASAILIAIGLAGAYTEMNSPGFGLPGIIAVIAFGLFFFGNYVAGNMAGYETAVLFGLGLILVIVDLFLFPGTLVAGLIGLVIMVTALGFSMVDRDAFGDFKGGGEDAPSLTGVLWMPAFALSAGLIMALGLIAVVMRFLPSLPPFHRLVLQTSVPMGTSMVTEPTLLNAQGETVTDLRPTGRVRIGGEVHDVTTQGEFLPRGTPVRVSRVQGDRLTVVAETTR